MNVYVFQDLEQVSDRYHSNGSVVVFAASLERAIELANEQPGCCIPASMGATHCRPCGDGPEMVFVFPDAGCC